MVCSYTAEINCGHDCSPQQRPASIGQTKPVLPNSSQRRWSHPTCLLGMVPCPAHSDAAQSLHVGLTPQQSPSAHPSGPRSLSSLESTQCWQHCRMNPSARLCILGIPYFSLVLPYLFPSLCRSTNSFWVFFNTTSAVKGMCCLTSFLRWFEIGSVPEKGIAILKYFLL